MYEYQQKNYYRYLENLNYFVGIQNNKMNGLLSTPGACPTKQSVTAVMKSIILLIAGT